MTREIIQTDKAPAAVGPYSQAVRANGFLYTAGQIPLDPADGKLIEGSVSEQAERVLENLKAVLVAGGANLASVIKTTVFLQNMNDFAEMNGVYSNYFTDNPPARSTIEVAGLPLGAKVEIEAIALLV
ncbi:MAG: RidA family protein [Thermodesulfobacteriota bacterium]